MINNTDIVLLNRRKGGIISSLNRFFTKFSLTHCALGIGKIRRINSVITADERVNIQPCENYYVEKNTDIYVYKLKMDIDIKIINNIITNIYTTLAGTKYDFTQTLFFIYRWFMETVFKKDVNKERNIFISGKNRSICSELVFIYLYEISNCNIELRTFLDKHYTQNTVNVADIYKILNNFPTIFELVEKRNK